MDYVFQEIAAGSALYDRALALREAVLRRPLGLSLTQADLARDRGAHHFAALSGGRVVGAAGLYPDREGVVRLRQMAVDGAVQGTGVGAALLRFAEGWARDNGVRRIETHARGTARGFYERLGYAAEGAEFSEQGIPHIFMWKTLAPQSA